MNSFISPAIADVMLVLVYITLGVALLATIFSVSRELSFKRKGDNIVNGVPEGRIGWIVAFGFVLCLAATFALGSTTPILSNGQLFTDKLWLRVADMFIYSTIILITGCFVSAIVSRFRS